MAAATSVKLVLPSEIRFVDLAHTVAEKMGELAGLDPEAALNVGLAVREAVINAIVHGNDRDPSRKVEVTVEVAARDLRIRVRDNGQGFDPGILPDPKAPENVLRSSGRGILLMRAFVDAVRFRYRRGRGMEVTLIKTLGPPGRAVEPPAGEAELARRT